MLSNGNNTKKSLKEKNYLQQKLYYNWNGEKLFIPQYAKFEKIVTIAGAGSDDKIDDINRLTSKYGGTEKTWRKQTGRITSDKYVFDVHWYENDDSIQHEVKLKNRKDKK